MALRDWSVCLPPLCGCGARPTEREEAGLLRRNCLRCGAGETLSLPALMAAAASSARAEALRTKHARN